MMLYPAMNKLTQYISQSLHDGERGGPPGPPDRHRGPGHEEHLDEKPVTLAIGEVAEGRFDAKSIDTAISDEA